MSALKEHLAKLRAMKPREGGWMTATFHTEAAITFGAHLDEIEDALTRLDAAEGRVGAIQRLARSDGNRTFDDCIRDLGLIDDLCRASTAGTGWLPIESAPKNGSSVLAYVDGFGMGPMVLFWLDGYWREPANHMGLKSAPTHWQPLPSPPVVSPRVGGGDE